MMKKKEKYNWEEKQKKYFCCNNECLMNTGWNYGCKQKSDARKCAAIKPF